MGAGCARRTAPAIDDIAKGYVGAALQLAQHQPALVEAWRGDPAWRPGPRRPVAEVRARITQLLHAIPQIERDGVPPVDERRVRYLRRQLQALDLAAGRLLGEQRAFADEVLAAYHVPLPQADATAAQEARQALTRLLPGDGPLGQRHAAFRRSITVSPDRTREVLSAALDACRAKTRANIALPANESIELTLGVDSQWDGFARYQGDAHSTIAISRRSPLDVSRALHLACHEAYPGHHTQDALLDGEANASGRVELLLQPAFGPHLLIAEGAAEAGADLAFPPDERTRLYRDVLLPRAGLPPGRAETLVSIEAAVFTLEATIPDIIAAYLDARASREVTLRALTNDAAVMDANALLAFAEAQRTQAVTYVLGRRLVAGWLAGQRGGEWQALAALFSTQAFAMDGMN